MPTDTPVPEQFELEPDDIHMVMELASPNHGFQRNAHDVH